MQLDRLQALAGPKGAELLGLLDGQELSGSAGMALGARLRQSYPTELVVDAFGLAELRRRARAKFALADDMFFTRPGLEQASGELVAGHRRARYAGATGVADLCCGIGGDLVALAADRPVLAVDRDPVHLWMAQRNAEVNAVAANVTAVEADVRDVELAGVDGAFVDPARRSQHGRMQVGDSEPPLAWCLALAQRLGTVGIKAAPGIPHENVPAGWELEFVSVGRELKEAALWSPALATAARRATLLPGGRTLTPEGGEGVAVREPGAYLLDPDPAVTRAGLVEEVARTTGTWKIDERIAFLSGDADVRTPFARTLRVLDSGPWIQKQLPARLRSLDVGSVDIRRRGLAGDVDKIARTLKLTGSRRATLVMTRVRDRPWALVCVDP